LSVNRASVVNRRVTFIGLLLGGALVLAFLYAAMLQVGYQHDFQRVADQIHLDSIVPLAGRGRIYDVKNRVVAFTRSYFEVRVYPTLLNDTASDKGVSTPRQATSDRRQQAANLLAKYSGRSAAEIQKEILTRPHVYVFDPDMNYETGLQLRDEARKIGLDYAIKAQLLKMRLYPYGDTLGAVLGYAVRDSGKTGLEAQLDQVLTGVPGKVVVQRDGLGNNYRFPAYPDVQPVNGADVRLTIDADFQRIAYEELKACVDSFAGDGGSAIVLECPTGAIRAMTDYPYYDPRRTLTKGERPGFKCRAIAESFEPGSVFKTALGLAALESPNADKIRATLFNASSGIIEICGKKIHDVHPVGVQDFPGIFIHSSNVGLSMLSMMVNRSLYYQTMHRLGFGEVSGIDLPYEDPGYMDAAYRTAPETMSPLRVANNAFGQGVQVTLLQLADCYAAVANDGRLMKPQLIQEIQSDDHPRFEARPLVLRQAVSASTARVMKDILARVVTDGTGQTAISPYFASCGKTGTAEKALPGRGYADGEIIATFVGFFPKENPRYVVAVSVDNPKIGKYAGTIVCPTFRRICERIYEFDSNREEWCSAGQGVAAR
jgi:cell division protein FtsI (penicillin-binding protein 3)